MGELTSARVPSVIYTMITTATKTYLGGPLGLAVDNAGNVLVGDGFGRVRKVSSDGAITTVAGTGQDPFSGDGGPAASAQLTNPLGGRSTARAIS
jgi:hypothetical protein